MWLGRPPFPTSIKDHPPARIPPHPSHLKSRQHRRRYQLRWWLKLLAHWKCYGEPGWRWETQGKPAQARREDQNRSRDKQGMSSQAHVTDAA
uniref:Uncharacterized protein n=1 Tax=Bracon brevicornis TaxID=1563983 RepID=A0A6V7LWX3_9HYME